MAFVIPLIASAAGAAGASSTVLAGLTAAGGAVSAVSSIRQGQAENAAAKAEARQLEFNAGQQRAAGQQAALAKRRESEILQSRALAVAGASGAGTVDPTVLNLIAGIDQEGERRVQAETFNAESSANFMTAQAQARRREGKRAKSAGVIDAAGQFVSTATQVGTFFGQDKKSLNDPVVSAVPIPGRKPVRGI